MQTPARSFERATVERALPMTLFLARRESFATVGSTNDVVREWLAAGAPEVCLAVSDEQSTGRGRERRSWVAPSGAALLLSLGFRPTWLPADQTWRLAAVASLAMADAAECLADLPAGSIRLKWPNDLVVEMGKTGEPAEPAGPAEPAEPAGPAEPAALRKIAGVLGETDGLGTADPRVVIGLGINADWAAADFPPDIAGSMTSLREVARGRQIDRNVLLDDFLARLESGVAALRAGDFDGNAWSDRQSTTGRMIHLMRQDRDEIVRALGVDPVSGALFVEDPATSGGRRVLVGEITHVRIAEQIAEQIPEMV